MQPLQYLQTNIGLIWVIFCVPLGFLLTALAYFIVNKVPAGWLCDYGEEPSEEILSGKRVNYLKTGIIVSVFVAALLVFARLEFNKGYDIYFAFLTLIIADCAMIVVSDLKYQIIPDQFTVILGILTAGISVYDLLRGYCIFHSVWWAPLAGAAIGAGSMIIVDLIGQLVYKKEGMGFGDVKLFAAVGILTGFPGTIYTFLISLLTATVCFIAVIIISKIVNSKNVSQNSDEEIPDDAEKEVSEEISDSDNSQESEESEYSEEETDKTVGFGTYLAFGPYIALAACLYISLFDLIQYAARMYLNLFSF